MSSLRIEPIDTLESLKNAASLLVEVYNSPPWNDEWTLDSAFRKLECYFKSPKYYGVHVYENDTLLGSMIGNIEPYFTGDHFYVKDMFVSVKAQRKGVGSLIMNHLKSYLEPLDVHMITLFTSNESYPFSFYLKNQFEEMDGMRMMYWGRE